MSCTCQSLPEGVFPNDGRLLLLARFGPTLEKVLGILTARGDTFQREDGIITIAPPPDGLRELIIALEMGLSSTECTAIRVMAIEPNREPVPKDYFAIESLDALARRAKGAWLREALRTDGVTSYYQPIVHAREPERIFAHEALLRVVQGEIVHSAGEAFALAHDTYFAQYLDRVARESAIRNASRTGLPGNLFINFLPSAIYDPVSCLSTALKALDECGFAHDRIVFEVVESDRIADPEHLRKILSFYREHGFRIALDDLGAGFSSLQLLNQLRPDFVKLDMALVQQVDLDPYKAILASKLVEAAQSLGILVVAEGIEREEELAWAQSQGIDFVQGYLTGRPQPPMSVLR